MPTKTNSKTTNKGDNKLRHGETIVTEGECRYLVHELNGCIIKTRVDCREDQAPNGLGASKPRNV